MKRSLVLIVVAWALAAGAYAGSMKNVVSASGVQGGVAVHLGCGGGKSTVQLYSGEKLLVYGLDRDPAKIEKAKAHIASKGIYGQVSAERYDGKNLPFGDNIVNLLIVEDSADLSSDEIERVLVPNGVVLAKSGSELLKSSGLKQEKTVVDGDLYRKPWPQDIDEWTHFLYGPDNNAVSRDGRIGKPEHLQWFAGPRYTRDHDALSSMSAMTSSDGRVFYIYDEGPVSVIHQPADWKLIARDAFNGKLLWKRAIPDWMTHLYNFRAGPVQLPRRLVSIKDELFVTLGFEAPVQKLNAATGETLLTYKGSDETEELIVHDGTLLLVTGGPEFMIAKADGCVGFWEMAEDEEHTISKQIIAYDAESGTEKWKLDMPELKGLVPLSLCAQGKHAFYMDNKKLHSVDLDSGRELWAADFETQGIFMRAYAPTVVVHDDVIICLYHNKIAAYETKNGNKLWEHGRGAIGFGSPADLFVKDDKAWIIAQHKGMQIKQKEALPAKKVTAFDIYTGEIEKTLPYVTNQHHHRCFRNKATANGIIIGYSGIQIFDWEKGTTDLNQWVRGLCQYGFMPANGYIYAPPNPCRCKSDVMLHGFFALSEKNSLDEMEVTPVLEKGSKQVQINKQSGTGNAAWNTYRGDAERNGSTVSALPAELKVKWDAVIGASVTASVISGGKVYVAERDAYTVYCLDEAHGKELWRYMANGPVDAPPTIENGLCVFGSGDGSVYCLDADKGKLQWRFKVSALERRMGSENRLASPWPINGAVLVLDGTVYFAAGRSSHLDGGIKLYGLDLLTGKQKCFTELISEADSQSGSLAGIMQKKGGNITMRGASFSPDLKPISKKTLKRSLLDGSWFHRHASAGKDGQISVKGDAGTYTVGTPYTGLKQRRKKGGSAEAIETRRWNQVGHLHQKYSRYLAQSWFTRGVKLMGPDWAVDEDLQVRAMLLAGNRLYLAGWIDEIAIELKTGKPLKGKERKAVMRVYSATDGSRINEYKLDAEPVWDSAAAANGKFFLSLKNGKLICMGESNPSVVSTVRCCRAWFSRESGRPRKHAPSGIPERHVLHMKPTLDA